MAYRIKQSKVGARRNILYADANLGLALNVKPGEDTDWCRILPSQAMRIRKKIPTKARSATVHRFLSEENIEHLLDEFDSEMETDPEDQRDGDDAEEEEAARDGMDAK